MDEEQAPASAEEPNTQKFGPIYVGFGLDKGCKGKFICALSEASFSHSWIEYNSGVWGGRWIAHATSRGVIKEYHEHVYDRYPKRVVYRCNIDLADGILAVRGRVGRSNYDFGGIVNLFIRYFYRRTHWEFLRRAVRRDSDRVTCSEFVAEILDHAGLKLKERHDPELTTTGDLVQLVENSEDFEFVDPDDLHGRDETRNVSGPHAK